MTDLYRVRTQLNGFPGAPGVVTQYFLDVSTALPSIYSFWQAVKVYLPSTVQIIIEPSGDIINDVTGTITSAWGAAPQAVTTCTGGGVYAAPCGAQVRWDTATILDGRRLRGRTFLVPLVSGSYQSDGSLLETARTAFGTAASAFQIAQNSSFVIWHRPRPAKAADGSRPAVAHRDGGHALVTAASVPDKVAVLRSRRD